MDRPGAHSILILEDEPLIALDLEQIVAEAGFMAVSTFTIRQNAKIWLTAHSPDVALIDIFLKDGRYSDVALALKELGCRLSSVPPPQSATQRRRNRSPA